MQVKIEDDNDVTLATINITHIRGTENYGYSFEEDGIYFAEGIIYNHDGDMYDLIERVLNGRAMYRKD